MLKRLRPLDLRRYDSGVTDAHAEHMEDHDRSNDAQNVISYRIGFFLLCVVRAHSLSVLLFFNCCSFVLFFSVGHLGSLRRQ